MRWYEMQEAIRNAENEMAACYQAAMALRSVKGLCLITSSLL